MAICVESLSEPPKLFHILKRLVQLRVSSTGLEVILSRFLSASSALIRVNRLRGLPRKERKEGLGEASNSMIGLIWKKTFTLLCF